MPVSLIEDMLRRPDALSAITERMRAELGGDAMSLDDAEEEEASLLAALESEDMPTDSRERIGFMDSVLQVGY